MSRAVIGAILAALIVVVTATAYMVTTSKLESAIHADVERRVASAQELLVQNSKLEMLGLLKLAEALALEPTLIESLSGDAPDTQAAAEVFQKFRAGLSPDEAQPDIMALTDDTGKLIALMNSAGMIPTPVPDTYLKSGKIQYPALEESIKNQIVTSEIWDYPGSGAMKVTVAPVLDSEINATLGTVLAAYAITAPAAKSQQQLLGADVVYFYGDKIHTTSFSNSAEYQRVLGKSLFGEGGLAEQALKSKKGLGDIKSFAYQGTEYLVTSGRLPRYSSKKLGKEYPASVAGTMVLISLTDATSQVATVGMAILLVGLFAIGLVFLAISLTARRILHPLEEVEVGVNDIINGNLDRTFQPVGSDLDGLANALNVMLARLLGRPEPGEEEFDDDGNIIRSHAKLPSISQTMRTPAVVDPKQAEALALAAEPMESYLRRVHSEFIQGGANDVNYEDFVQKLMTNEATLKQKYGAREVRFKVVVSGGQVTLKPVPIM